jgi:hypothetical protein
VLCTRATEDGEMRRFAAAVGLAVEERDELGALTLAEAADRLRR